MPSTKHFALSLFLSLSFFTYLPIQACLCGSHYANLNSAAGPVITIPAYTLPRNRFVFGFGMNFTNFGEFNNRKLNSLNRKGVHAHSIDTALLLNANLSYGLTDDLDLIMVIPYYFGYDMRTTDMGNTINDGDSIGFGDISLLAKYRFLNIEEHDFTMAAIAGIKMPTGDTNQKNEFGYLLGSDDQPGSGSWDPIMGLALSKRFGKINLDSNVLYLLSTEGKQDTISGDQVFFNLGLSRKLESISTENFKWTTAFEVNGQWQEKVESLGIKDPNHGGLVIYLTPGLKLNYKDRVFTNIYTSFPTIQNLNGIQSDINLQLGFNLNFLI
jgi:hypothetical protein